MGKKLVLSLPIILLKKSQIGMIKSKGGMEEAQLEEMFGPMLVSPQA